MKKNGKAVALSYKNGDHAPVVIAKAKDILFEKMIKIARENGVIVYKDSDLAEVLFHIREGKEIPFELYSAVSEVIAYCWKVNGTIE
ncbi:MAG TPA: EscU/YscU/HrcU family type III secretion system export apparatus switch protein [Spirochaetota bacterium]|jgi:type III secretion system FlhB-like substrate exporter|nr:EscU/YscU/HrcU family type III secretion system export apparatus switch protein [Spirochaetota bacterium]HOH37553.1 EscU/YscU/HrcU family type III secretion system export apparatus switch protein [Spirochaetota bacterium]HPW52451.1 EscU/YscU/HrcU family type III secretion system export apparatus switch protein [Spirochaetota bacterium]HPY02823.1 EscU/YscU/HrcU family type III secretion system export apparatus switch protein [Spirochaetota bacterium]HQA51901.1 EscU/YscU/HrcU family type III s